MNAIKTMCGLLALALTVLSTSVYAGNAIPQDYEAVQQVALTPLSSDHAQLTVERIEFSEAFGTCTIDVSTTLDNGTTIEGTVTIDGIKWYECWGLKIKDFFSSDF